MELILAIVAAGPIGFWVTNRRHALCLYLGLWAVVFPIQTVVVFSSSDGGGDALYWIFNTLILCGGVALNQLGFVLRQRRRAKVAAATAKGTPA